MSGGLAIILGDSIISVLAKLFPKGSSHISLIDLQIAKSALRRQEPYL